MRAVPLTLKEASAFVEKMHRHHKPAIGDKFRIGCEHDGKLVGVVQVGRPVSRALDDGTRLEVIRLCTDGTKNVCSFLYGAAARVAKELGYSEIITYILISESGDSLRAAGWTLESVTRGGSWDTPARRRKQTAPICQKQRYHKILREDKV